jgi:hypothetical protein
MDDKKKNADEERLNRARADLKQMKEEIAPFVKERDRRQYSTAGQWRDTRRVAAERSLSRSSRAGSTKAVS